MADIKLGLRFVGFCSALWLAAFGLIFFAGPLGLFAHLNIIVLLATLVPFFVVRFFAVPYLTLHPGKPAFKDMLPFMVTGFVGVSLAAFVFEAMVMTRLIGEAEGVGFMDVLTQPLSERYNMATFAGLTFWTAASAITAISLALRFPASVHLRHRWANPSA